MSEATASDDGSDGVQIDLSSGNRMTSLTNTEKIQLILDGVRDGSIIILEEGLSSDGESKFIKVTMAEVNPGEFSDIEVETYPHPQTADQSFLDQLMGRQSTQKLTVIGPASQIQTLHEDEDLVSVLISRE